MSGNVIDIYDWERPGPKVCAIPVMVTPTQAQTKPKLRLSEIGLVIALVALISLLIASYV